MSYTLPKPQIDGSWYTPAAVQAAYAAGLEEGRKQVDPIDRSGLKDKRIVILSGGEVVRISQCLAELEKIRPKFSGCAEITAHSEAASLSSGLLMRLAAAPEPKP